MVRIDRKDPKWLQRFVDQYKTGEVLAVGWPAGPAASIKYPDGEQVAMVAAVNNYGSASRGIPARPFMTEGGAAAVEATRPIKEKLIPKLNKGRIKVAQILEVMGPFAVAAVQRKIKDGNWEPNAPATAAAKGSDTPLKDTGLMSQSITYVVRPGK